MINDALIEVQTVDMGDYVEATEYWDLSHPDCPFVKFGDAKDNYIAIQYLTANETIQ